MKIECVKMISAQETGYMNKKVEQLRWGLPFSELDFVALSPRTHLRCFSSDPFQVSQLAESWARMQYTEDK